MSEQKPFSQACENNKQVILDVLLRVFSDRKQVLEVGSGTGQHAVHFAPKLPRLVWQTADLKSNHPGINAWINEFPAENIRPPLPLNVDNIPWLCDTVDAVFSANTCHIMAWSSVINMFSGLDTLLRSDGVLAIYGPFNYKGKFTSKSNERFDQWLKQQAAHQGIRDFEAINQLANTIGLKLVEDNEMPANNRLLVWRRE